jgi:uncharacterized coiled-coil protein SlyX
MAVGDGVSSPGGAASVRSSRADALDLLMEAWQATFCQAAGCPSTPTGQDVLVLRSGATVRGVLTWCGGDVCSLGTSHFPVDEIEWIGLAPTGDSPPASQNPGVGEVHLDDGAVRVGNLVSLGERFVLTDAGGHQRPDVAWIHVVPGEEEEEEEPPAPPDGGAPDGGAPDGGVTPPAGGGDGGGQEFDGPVYDPSDDVATPGNRGRQRLAQSGRSSGDPPDEEEDDCADERREVELLQAQMDALSEALDELGDRISETPGAGNWLEEGYTGPGADLAEEWRRMDRALYELLARLQAAEERLRQCEGGGSDSGDQGEDSCPDRAEVERLQAQLDALTVEVNELGDRISEIPGAGNWTEEGYTGPGADLAEQWRRMIQEQLDLVGQLNAAEERLQECEAAVG